MSPPDGSRQNWSRFLHRLWIVYAVPWAILSWLTTTSPKPPDAKVYERVRLCHEIPPPTKEQIDLLLAALDNPGAFLQTPPAGMSDADFAALKRQAERPFPATCDEDAAQMDTYSIAWRSYVTNMLCMSLGPPLVVLVAGHALAWAIRGLRSD